MAVALTYENYQAYKQIAASINGKLTRIWETSTFKSSSAACREHFEYKQLLKMGPKIIPYIIHQMVEDGASWTDLCLLSDLSGENPIPTEHAGKFYCQVADWILWFESSKYNKKYVYFGLLDDDTSKNQNDAERQKVS
jgi:hypothetical protein